MPSTAVQLLHRLGAGASGEVWLATDAAGRRIALKRVPGKSVGRASALERELRALRILSDQLADTPGLVRVLHVGQTERELWYTMELADLEGDPPQVVSLDREIDRRGRFDTIDAIELIDQLLDALSAVHEAGIVHRDIKPSNILRVGGRWKLGDIGLLGVERTEMTAVGTPDFIPPWGPIDRRADLYALGRVLYCMVTGLPARAFPTLPPELLTPERQRETKLLNRLITKACDPDPDARFQSADEFIAAIDRTRSDISASDPLSRRRALLLLGGAGAAVVLGATPWAIGRWKNASRPPLAWVPLFDGVSLRGWKFVNPWDSELWRVENGAIVARQDLAFKSLVSELPLGYGRFRAIVTPSNDRGRLGLTYGNPGGSQFLLYEDKYVWIRHAKDPDAPEQPGRWQSFPGPVIPRAGESITMEVDWRPRLTRLIVNGQVLQEVNGQPKSDRVGLHVWGGDGGAFRDVEFQPHRGSA
ncbi:MAG: hypothetical protein Kow0022_03880 [Phycisphaerales bacterium]